MQEATEYEDIVALVEAVDLEVEAGLDLLDADDAFVLDLSEDFLVDGSFVEHLNFRTIHTTSKLRITRRLQSTARVRPRVKLTSRILDLWGEWNVGIYLLDPPEHHPAEMPTTYEYDGFDKLSLLARPTGRTVTQEAGEPYLDFAVARIVEAGEAESSVQFDFDTADWLKAPDNPRTWSLGDETTWLKTVNDSLDAVGGRGCWADQDGKYRSESYVLPSQRSSEWVFDADDEDTIVGEERYEEATEPPPNVWIFVDADSTKGTPTVANGRIYRVENQSDGEWSIDAVGPNPRIVMLDAADSDSLIAQGNRIVALDKRTPSTRVMPSGIIPVLWHLAVIDVRDNALGSPKKMQDISWRMPLNGDDMSRVAKEV